MNKFNLFASLLIVASAIPTGAIAQNVYKCGPTTYSQTPCPDGIKLPPAQVPDRTLQSQAEQATARDASTADRMEQARLRQEKRDLKANTPAPTKETSKSAAPTPPARTRKAAKPKDFVAEVPGTQKPPAKRKTKTD